MAVYKLYCEGKLYFGVFARVFKKIIIHECIFKDYKENTP